MRTRTTGAGLWVAVAALIALAGPGYATSVAQQPRTFAARVAELSEAGGYFDTDNLISNERTFLSVLPSLRQAGVRGGVYLGVGPDQNFSYIAAIGPSLAFMIDIRRDNLLLHLLFKALFAEARSRVDYLSLLCGRQLPADEWRDQPVAAIAAYVRRAPVHPALSQVQARLARRIQSFGVPLASADLATIARFHQQFIDQGLDLRFHSTGRAPQAAYPTLGDLVLATDPTGQPASYLASEDGFQFVKTLQATDRIVPVVGDLSGPSAVRAIGRFLRAEGLSVTALYASNVEFYLERSGTYRPFIENLRALPLAPAAVIIRSEFGGGVSRSSTQPIRQLLGR